MDVLFYEEIKLNSDQTLRRVNYSYYNCRDLCKALGYKRAHDRLKNFKAFPVKFLTKSKDKYQGILEMNYLFINDTIKLVKGCRNKSKEIVEMKKYLLSEILV